MINLNIERIQKDLIGLKITDDLIIESVDISILKEQGNNCYLTIYVLNTSISKRYCLSDIIYNERFKSLHNIVYIALYSGYLYLTTYRNEVKDYINKTGIIYDIKKGELKTIL